MLLQWATGGLLFLWVTTRRRLVGVGYGWLLRGVFGAMAVGSVLLALRFDSESATTAGAAGVAVAAAIALLVSIVRRRAGISGERADAGASSGEGGGDEQRPDDDEPDAPPGRVASRAAAPRARVPADARPRRPRRRRRRTRRGQHGRRGSGCSPWLARWSAPPSWAASPTPCSSATGTSCSPVCRRAPIVELIRWCGIIWPIEVVLLLLPPGMVSVLEGDDRRRLQRAARMVLGGLRGHDRSACCSWPGRPFGSGPTQR